MKHRHEFDYTEGDVIEHRYVLGREVGRGGMGSVHKAYDEKLERPVAIKFLDPRLLADSNAVLRFQREALAAGHIGHPNICDVRDRGETDEEVPFIVMELLEGQSLADVFALEERLPPVRLGELMLQVLSALHAAHEKKIIHRDLKPENIFVTRGPQGEEWIKLLDFGISKFFYDDDNMKLTSTGVVLGTPYYMSPEQAGGSSNIDQRVDLWAVGAILYEGLTGVMPFPGSNYNEVVVGIIMGDLVPPIAVVEGLPEEFDAIITRAMAREIEDRFSSATEFASTLREVIGAPDERLSLPMKMRAPTEVSRSAITMPDSVPEDPEEDPALAETRASGESQAVLISASMTEKVVHEEVVAESETPEEDLSDGVVWEEAAPESVTHEEVTLEAIEPTPLEAIEPTPKRRRSRLATVAAAAVVTFVAAGGAISYLSRGEDRTEEPLLVEPATSPGDPTGEVVAPVEPPPLVNVRLIGLPEGASATFADLPVKGGVVQGAEGQEGELVIEAEGYEPLKTELTLAKERVVDLDNMLRRVKASGADTSSRRGSEEENRTRRPAKRPRPVVGPDGTQLVTEYEEDSPAEEPSRPAEGQGDVSVTTDYEE